MFPRWDVDRIEICARIERVRSPLKIVLKTKNDPFFIERWINHHMKIVGPENIIIFDNMSDDPEVLSTYRKFRGQIETVRFSGPWFMLHHTKLLRRLYASLARSADYFIFIDTDEFLVFIDHEAHYADDRIVSFVRENFRYDLFPTSWLFNANWTARQFSCGAHAVDLAKNLACGKPLIRSNKIPSGYVNHNFQLSMPIFAPPFKVNLFLLHMTRLYPRQRIAANVNKLISAGFAKRAESPEAISNRTDISDKVMAGYVEEIRDCLAAENKSAEHDAALSSGCLELTETGRIRFYGDAERKVLVDFIADPRTVYEAIPHHYRLETVIASNFGPWNERSKLQV